MRKKATKGTSVKRHPSGRSKKSRGEPAVTLESVHRRLTALEQHVHGSGIILGFSPTGDMRCLVFTLKAENAPRIAQLVLQDTGEELVLTRNQRSKNSNPRSSGIEIEVGITTYGDPGQKAVIDVTNVSDATTPIVTSVLTGSSAKDATKIETEW